MTAADQRATTVARRIEEAVQRWRAANPHGDAGQMLAAIGGRFPGRRALLKVELWATDLYSAGGQT
jgi:hypothetical protein